MADLNENDLDLMARTLIGEAGNQGEGGQAAVAHTILNRLHATGFGDDVPSIVLAKNQFEPWTTRRRELMGISTNSPAYQQAYAVAKGAAGGDIPDPTNGATHFFAPKAQAALGRPIPGWAMSQGTPIGDHVFFRQKGLPPPVIAMPKGPASDPFSDYPTEAPALAAPTGTPAVVASPSIATPRAGGDPFAEYPTDGHPLPGAAPVAAGAIPQGPIGANGLVWDTAGGHDPKTGELIIGGKPFTGPATSQGLAAGASTLSGIPIAGPALLGGVQRAAAGASALAGGQPYDQTLAGMQAITDASNVAYPKTALGGRIAGAVGGTLPMVMAAPAAFGVGAGSVPLRAGVSALTNAGIGGTDAAIRGGNGTDIAQAALLGGAFGAGAPVIGQGVGVLARPFLRAAAPATPAENSLLGAMGGLGPADLARMSDRLAANPRLAPMDIADPLQMRAMGIATQPGEGRNVLEQFVHARNASAGEAVSGAYDAALGPAPDVLATLQGMRQTAATNAAQGFGEALRDARPVNVSGVLRAIDERLTPGVNGIVSKSSGIPPSAIDSELLRIRARLAGPDGESMLTDANKLHEIQSALRTDADTLMNSASGQDRRVGGAISDVRRKLVNAIDDATDGKFKPAQKQYADDMAVQGAFDKGAGILSNAPKALENRPEFWADWVKNAAPAELAAVKLGARTAVDQKLGAVRNAARTGSTLTDIGLNTDRLKHVLGEAETEQLTNAMRDAQAEYATSQKLFQNSQTQPRAEAARATAVPAITGGGPEWLSGIGGGVLGELGFHSPIIGTALGLGIPLARRGAQYLAQRSALSRNLNMARMLSAPGQAGADVINRLSALTQGAGVNPAHAPVSALISGEGQYTGQEANRLTNRRGQ